MAFSSKTKDEGVSFGTPVSEILFPQKSPSPPAGQTEDSSESLETIDDCINFIIDNIIFKPSSTSLGSSANTQTSKDIAMDCDEAMGDPGQENIDPLQASAKPQLPRDHAAAAAAAAEAAAAAAAAAAASTRTDGPSAIEDPIQQSKKIVQEDRLFKSFALCTAKHMAPVTCVVTDSAAALPGNLNLVLNKNKNIWLYMHDIYVGLHTIPDREKVDYRTGNVREYSQVMDAITFLKFIESVVSDPKYITKECEDLANLWNKNNMALGNDKPREPILAEFVLGERTWYDKLQKRNLKSALVLQLNTYGYTMQLAGQPFRKMTKDDVTCAIKYKSLYKMG